MKTPTTKFVSVAMNTDSDDDHLLVAVLVPRRGIRRTNSTGSMRHMVAKSVAMSALYHSVTETLEQQQQTEGFLHASCNASMLDASFSSISSDTTTPAIADLKNEALALQSYVKEKRRGRPCVRLLEHAKGDKYNWAAVDTSRTTKKKEKSNKKKNRESHGEPKKRNCKSPRRTTEQVDHDPQRPKSHSPFRRTQTAPAATQPAAIPKNKPRLLRQRSRSLEPQWQAAQVPSPLHAAALTNSTRNALRSVMNLPPSLLGDHLEQLPWKPSTRASKTTIASEPGWCANHKPRSKSPFPRTGLTDLTRSQLRNRLLAAPQEDRLGFRGQFAAQQQEVEVLGGAGRRHLEEEDGLGLRQAFLERCRQKAMDDTKSTATY